MSQHSPLVIIGAGPAGMAAAETAVAHGIKPIVIDEQPEPGGQIYRSVGSTPLKDPRLLGKDYWQGQQLAQTIYDEAIDYRPNHIVWQVTEKREVGVYADNIVEFIQADQLILATGAQERPFPIPGWVLPGVMGAGAAQALMKSSGLVPDTPVVIAGCGPLLFLVAAQYHRAGVPISAVLETTNSNNSRRAVKHSITALKGSSYLLKGMGLIKELKRAGIRHEKGVSALRAEGEGRLQTVLWKSGENSGDWKSIDASILLLHQGVVPNIQIPRALRMDLEWDDNQLCWKPKCNRWGEGSLSGIRIAGDGGGIGGAVAAEIEGRIAALGALKALRCLDDAELDRKASPLERKHKRETAIRPFLDVLYKPEDKWRKPEDEVVICRCEEVTAGQVRELAKKGCMGPNQMKAFTRCGMGPCQGRMCGLTVTELLAEANGVTPTEVGSYRLRPPFKPLPLGLLAGAVEQAMDDHGTK